MSEKPESWTAIDSFVWPHIAANLIRTQHAEIERLRDELRQSSIDIPRAEIERLREALKLALNSHGRMLMSDPPQDAWKFHRVDEVIAAALRREET